MQGGRQGGLLASGTTTMVENDDFSLIWVGVDGYDG